MAASPGETPERWLPADVGNRWSYVYTRERRRVDASAEETVESLRGSRVDRVVADAGEIAPGAVEIRSVVRGRSESAATDTVENRRFVVSTHGPGFRIHLREAPHLLTGEPQVSRFDPPFDRMRPDARRAEPWKSGVEQSGGLRTEYESEVLGIQDAQTPAGLYEKCLVLRTRGVMSGSVHIYGQSVAVDEGHVVITEWFAPGVGRVLAKTEIEQKLGLADGSRLELFEKSQFALSAVDLAGSADLEEPVVPAAPAHGTAAPAPWDGPPAAAPAPPSAPSEVEGSEPDAAPAPSPAPISKPAPASPAASPAGGEVADPPAEAETAGAGGPTTRALPATPAAAVSEVEAEADPAAALP
ncbi:MAG: hypothetical protein ACQGVK_17375 [Myxococcota bacterium]